MLPKRWFHPSELSSPDDDEGLCQLTAANEEADQLRALYDQTLPEVFGFLVRRCPVPVAGELTSATFLAADLGAHHRAALTVEWSSEAPAGLSCPTAGGWVGSAG